MNDISYDSTYSLIIFCALYLISLCSGSIDHMQPYLVENNINILMQFNIDGNVLLAT